MNNIVNLLFFEGFYGSAMAVVNYVCFGSLVICCLLIYWAATIGQLSKGYKQAAIGMVFYVIILIGVHICLAELAGITLLVPPIETPFFTEFMHVIQFFCSVAVVLLGVFIFITAVVKNVAKEYGKHMMSCLIFLAILVVLHNYIESEFGIPLIFPPNLW